MKHGVNNTSSMSSSGANSNFEDDGDASRSDGKPEDGNLWDDEPDMGDESKPTGWNALAGLDVWIDGLAMLSDEELNKVTEASAPVQKVLSKTSPLSANCCIFYFCVRFINSASK